MSEEGKSPATAGRQFLVSGRVQRVGFRAATRRKALALGLCGHARNLPDGRVEVVAGGRPAALSEFARWLRQGPPLARVDRVEEFEVARVDAPSFVTG